SRPASFIQPTTRSRPLPSNSVSASRQFPPLGVAPIFASSISDCHRRSPLTAIPEISVMSTPLCTSSARYAELGLSSFQTAPPFAHGLAYPLHHVAPCLYDSCRQARRADAYANMPLRINIEIQSAGRVIPVAINTQRDYDGLRTEIP